MKYAKLIIIASATFFASCASVTTLQTAETNRPGQVSGYGAWVPTVGPLPDSNGNMKGDTNSFQTIEFGGRVGLTQNVDMGIKVFPFGGILDVKNRFYQNGMFHMAGDVGVGYSSIGDSTSKVTIIDFNPAFLATARPFSWLAATVAPKVLVRTTMADKTNIDILAGATAGLKFTTSTGSGYLEFGKFGGSYGMTFFAIGVERSIQLWGSDKAKEPAKSTEEKSEPLPAFSPVKSESATTNESASF